MKALNYEHLMADNPTVYTTITNKQGQTFDLVEDPIEGDECPVIIVSHEYKVAYYSTFFDTQDMEDNGDYTPVYLDGQMCCAFEVTES